MGPQVVAFTEGIVTLVVFAGIGLTGFWLWSHHRGRPQPDPERVLDVLREDNAQLHADLGARITELEDRLDFVERRMVRAGGQGQAPSTRIPTPV
jgi:hypothetical protein